jgi:fibronectin-binding autotransporter adhesin
MLRGIVIVCAVFLAGGAVARAQVVSNGNFNNPAGGTSTTWTSGTGTPLMDWTMDSTPSGGVEYGTTFGTPGISSTQSLLLATTANSTSFNQGGIQQTLATVPGQVYDITIEAKEDKSASAPTLTLEFGGSSNSQSVTFGSLTQTWTGLTWAVTATSSSTILNLIGYHTAGLTTNAVVVSDLIVTPVPAVWLGGSSTDWGTAANWGSDIVPNAAGAAVTFGTAGANGSVSIASGSRTVGTLNFVNSVQTTISGSGSNNLILDNTGVSSSAMINVSGSHSISANIQLNSPAAVSITSGTLNIGGVMADGSNGPQGVMLSGPGTLTLATANTFSGTTSIASGTLLLSNPAALQSSTLANTGAVTFGTTSGTLGGLSGNGSITLATATGQAVALEVGNNGQSTNFGGALGGGGSLTKIGSGALTMSGANTFSGNTYVSSGTLVVGTPLALQDSPLDPSGSGTFSFGTQTAATLGGLTNTGTLNLANVSAQSVSLSLNTAGNLTFPGPITGPGSVTMSGAGAQVLTGSNGYTGGSNVNGGTLQFLGAKALPSGAIGLGGGVISIANDGSGSGGTISLGSNITLTAGATVGIDVRNNGSGNTNNVVSFGTLSNGTPVNALNSTINFTAANGYRQSFTGLNLSGSTGYTTVLNPATTTVSILGNVVNQMAPTASGQYDTLDLDGTSTGNIIYGAISDSSNFGGVNEGDTRITKSNSSQWVLAGSGNSYSGPTLISGGTLQLGTGRSGQDGTLGNSGVASGSSVTNNAALVYDYFGSVTAMYPIAGSGTLSMIGPGSITLNASNTYTGPTNITAGTLALGSGGFILQSSAINLRSGVTFDVSQVGSYELGSGQTLSGTGNYTVNGSMTADSGSKILPGGVASAGTLNSGGLTLSPGSTLSYDLSTGATLDLINVSTAYGGLTINGGGLSLYQSNGTSAFTTPGTYLLMNYGNGNFVYGSPSNLSVLNPTASNTYSFTATGGSLDLTIQSAYVWTGSGGSPFNWSVGNNWSTHQAPASGQAIQFAGTVGLTNNNNLNLSGGSLTGILFAPSAGAFTLNGGDVPLGGALVNTSTANQTIGLPITLVGGYQNFNAASGTITVNGVIDDGGQGYGINVSGPGTVVLGGANTYSGSTTVTGPLRLANSAALQDSTLDMATGGSLSFAATITSPTVAGLTGSGNISLVTSTSQAVALSVGSGGQSTTYSGTLKGSGSLVKQGYDTLTLTASQTYGGATLITLGDLQLVTSSASLPASSPVTISNGATLDMTDLRQTILSLSSTDGMGSMVLLGTGALTIANTAGTSTTFDGVISGGSGSLPSLTVQGGRFTLTGQNTYTGGTSIVSGGTLQLATGPNGDGSIYNNGSGIVNDNGALLYNFNDLQTVGYTITGQGSLRLTGGGILTLTATNSYLGATAINGGTLQLGNGQSGYDGALYVSVVSTSGVTDNGALIFDLAGSQTAPYRISGSGSLSMIGDGMLTLSGSNTYNGGTFVEAGTLVAANSDAFADGSSLTVGNPAYFGTVAPAAAASSAAAVPVPEPGGLALTAAAASGVALVCRLRRRSRRGRAERKRR